MEISPSQQSATGTPGVHAKGPSPPPSPSHVLATLSAQEHADYDTMMEEAAAIARSPHSDVNANGLIAALERSGTANTVALAAALSSRRSSDEDVHNQQRLLRPPQRPTMPRSRSHDSPTASFSSGSSGGSSTTIVATAPAPGPPSKAKPPPMIRRSSRTQAGMGRDLEQELIMASQGQLSLPERITPPDEKKEDEMEADVVEALRGDGQA